jgi:ATP-dependent Clp protease adaptor protein ClpS
MKNNVNKEYTTSVGAGSETKEPSLYQVLLHKDDFTPMEFVVSVLEKFFYMTRQRATEVMLDAQQKGKAVCGIFAKDFAESKISQVIEHAEGHEHPLNCSMESA